MHELIMSFPFRCWTENYSTAASLIIKNENAIFNVTLMHRNAKTTVCMRFLVGTSKFQRLSLWGLFSMSPSHLFPAILPQEAAATSPSNQSSVPTDTHPNTRFSAGLCNTMCTPSCVTIISNRKQIWTYWLMLHPKSLAQEHFSSFSALFFIFYTYIRYLG